MRNKCNISDWKGTNEEKVQYKRLERYKMREKGNIRNEKE